MLDRFQKINRHPSYAEIRKLGRTLLLAFPCAGLIWTSIGWLITDEWHWTLFSVFIGLALIVGGSLFAIPGKARPVWLLCQYQTAISDLLFASISLTIAYYLVMTPIGLLMRLCGRQPVLKGFRKEATSYWEDAEPQNDPARYYRQF